MSGWGGKRHAATRQEEEAEVSLMPWTPAQKRMLGAKCGGAKTKGFKGMSRAEACAATKEGTKKKSRK